ncbi:MAG: hypothetical protein WD075_10600 [Rhodospirillales bacterium]
MNPLTNMMRGWAQKRYRKEALQMLEHIRKLDNDAMGLVLAIAAHHRNALMREGVDLRHLTALSREAPMCQHELAQAVNVLAKKKRQHDALGLQVWVHSLRGVVHADVYGVGLDIWRELKRGLPHVAKARTLVRKETGFDLNIAMAGEIPAEYAEEYPSED